MNVQLGVNHPIDKDVPLGIASSTVEGKPAVRVPFTIPYAQMYYWRSRWQEAERESIDALEAGDYVDFNSDDPSDVRRWLSEPDDE